MVVAEITARELGSLDLRDAPELASLIAKRDPRVRGRRASARWLRRWLEETPTPTIDDAVMVSGLLGALAGNQHDPGLAALRVVVNENGAVPRRAAQP